MKKLFLALFAALLLYLAFWFVKETFFHPPRTFVKMYEGSASIYYVSDKGEQEYLGILHPGQSIWALPQNSGPFADFNIAQWFVPQAIAIFKTTIAKFGSRHPVGVYKYFFTEENYDTYITSKLRKTWVPDMRVKINPDGFVTTATLVFDKFKIPIRATGMVGINKDKRDIMYVYFKDISIGKFHFPRFFLDWFANSSNKQINKGTFTLELQKMEWRRAGIDITYYKKTAYTAGLEDRVVDVNSTPPLIQKLQKFAKKIANFME